MAAEPTLRLVDLEADQGDTFLLERRSSTRRRIAEHVTTVMRDEIEPGRARIGSLRLVNISDSGIGAETQDHVSVGSLITLFFPPHGSDRGFDLRGRVVRCNHAGDGYDLGIALDGVPTANVA